MTDLAVPRLHAQIGFGALPSGGDFFVLDDPVRGQLNNTTYLLGPDTVWEDVSDDLEAHRGQVLLDTFRGRSRETAEMAPGRWNLRLANNHRRYDPTNDDSPFAGQIVPRRRVKVTADVDGQQLPIVAGFVEDWLPDQRSHHASSVTIPCRDALAVVAGADLDELATPQHGGDTTGERISRVLDADEVGFPASRAIDDGLSTVGPTEFGENAARHVQRMARSEQGWLFVAADGTLTFRDRHTALSRNPAAVLSDGGDGIPYETLRPRASADLLYTRIVVTDHAGDRHVAADQAARSEFLTRTLTVDTGLDAADAQDLAGWLLTRFAQPAFGFDEVEIALEVLDPAQQAVVLGLDLTDLVEVVWHPVGGGSPNPVTVDQIVEGITHTVTTSTWRVRLQLASADPRSFLRLDDPDFGRLDHNRLAF